MQKKIITNSEMGCVKACVQKWAFKYLIGYRWEAGRGSPAITKGKAMHAGLEKHYKGLGGTAIIEAIEKEYLGNVNDAHEAWVIMCDYLDHYTCDNIGNIVNVEFEFRIPLFTPGGRASRLFEIAGKIDLVVEINGEYWIVDHKTRATIGNGDSDAEILAINQQARLYCYAYQIYTGRQVAGFIYNLIKSKPPSTPKIKIDGSPSIAACDTTAEIFALTMNQQHHKILKMTEAERKAAKVKLFDPEDYRDKIEKLKENRFFHRVARRYTEQDYKDIQQEIYLISKQMHEAERTGFFPKNDASCDHYAGCSYKGVCTGNEPDGLVVSSDRHQELDGAPLRAKRRGYVLDFGQGRQEADVFEEVSI